MTQDLKEKILAFLKGEAVKLALSKFLIGSAVGNWVLAFVLKEIFDKYGDPSIRALFRKSNLLVNQIKGGILVSKIDNSNSTDDYDSSVDDLFG